MFTRRHDESGGLADVEVVVSALKQEPTGRLQLE
jgi:hypothetical protein